VGWSDRSDSTLVWPGFGADRPRTAHASTSGTAHALFASGRVGSYFAAMEGSLTLTAVFTPMRTAGRWLSWPAVVTCGRTVDEVREMLADVAREMIASYRAEGREPPIGGGRVESITIDFAA
jgi:predicted RNase H-like HicB family nuclease